MPLFKISWSIRKTNSDYGGSKLDPAWTEIKKKIEELKTYGGTLTLSCFSGDSSEPMVLQMEAEDQNFILNFGEDTGEAYEVKSLQDTSSREGLTEILGNYWDSHFVFQDFSVASGIFSEFYKTKKISHPLLK